MAFELRCEKPLDWDFGRRGNTWFRERGLRGPGVESCTQSQPSWKKMVEQGAQHVVLDAE